MCLKCEYREINGFCAYMNDSQKIWVQLKLKFDFLSWISTFLCWSSTFWRLTLKVEGIGYERILLPSNEIFTLAQIVRSNPRIVSLFYFDISVSCWWAFSQIQCDLQLFQKVIRCAYFKMSVEKFLIVFMVSKTNV